MSFSNPAAALWVLLGIPIVIFYLMKVRLRREPVATTLFWQQVVEEKTARSIWQQLRHVLSLLLQLLFLGLLVFSLTDPFWKNDNRTKRRIVAILDVSASMQAIDESGLSRFQVATDNISELITSLKAEDELALIAGGVPAEVICGFTSHQRTLQKRLQAVSVTDGVTGIPAALAISQQLLADDPQAETIVYSDGSFSDSESIHSRSGVSWSQVGQSVANVGITRFQVRRSLTDLTGFEILIEVINFSAEPMSCKLDLSFNDRVMDVQPLELQPGEKWREVFAKTSVSGGQLLASLRFNNADYVDGLATDNAAFAILPQQTRTPVTLVTRGNWFLQRVLEANEAVDLTIMERIPASVPDGSVLILHGDVPSTLPSGSLIVVDPTSSTNLWRYDGKVDNPLIGSQRTDDPLLRHVHLDHVMMPEASKLIPTTDFVPLAEAATGEPLYFLSSRPEGEVLVLPVNLDQGDLTLRTAFPIMLTNALTRLAGQNNELVPAMATSVVRTIRLPNDLNQRSAPDNPQINLTAPDGTSQTIRISDGSAMIGPLDQCGIWKISPQTDTSRSEASPSMHIACNLMDAQESNLQTPEPPATRPISALPGQGHRPIWYYLVLLALAITVVEWSLFQRRWIA